LLVGTQVPAIGKDGMETLRDTADAKEWQEAVRGLLVAEIKENATAKMEESGDFLETVHASIDLFKNNKDLIPGTKTFDRKLADQFAGMMKPYEVRVDGKLQGYSIPVQPIIDNLRAQNKAGAPTPPPAAVVPPESRPQAEPPQAGIQSKAGSSTEKEDFSTLFGTIGLPHLQI
jgi:predicted house-cleaning noncanonical NTP pyrophosphatase (MazG superfamily)